MKKTFLDLGCNLANDFRNILRYKLKLASINKHVKKEKIINHPYRSSKSKLVEKLFKNLSKTMKI